VFRKNFKEERFKLGRERNF